jgi:competence protein ComGC
MKRRSGFTFVELVLVLWIILTLVVLLLPAIQSSERHVYQLLGNRADGGLVSADQY